MQRKALCLLLMSLLLAATACSRLPFMGTKGRMEHLSGEQIAQDYSVSDSPEVKRRQTVRTLLARAVQRLQSGQADEAEKDARAALKLEPGSADAVTLLGIIEDRRGNAVLAGQHYRRAAELAPAHGGVQNNYGTWLCANGFAAESLVWFDRAVQAPGYATPAAALANAGSCALKAGIEQAREAIEGVGANLDTAFELTLERFLALDTMGSEHARSELRTLKHDLYARGEPAPDRPGIVRPERFPDHATDIVFAQHGRVKLVFHGKMYSIAALSAPLRMAAARIEGCGLAA